MVLGNGKNTIDRNSVLFSLSMPISCVHGVCVAIKSLCESLIK